jgi:hypothetical protein
MFRFPISSPAEARFFVCAATFSPRYGSALGSWRLRGRGTGERTMATRILNDLLLFSCLAAFVTGIVLAAASLLI